MADFSHEDSLPALTCGLDEAGRGPLAGPVVAACVLISSDKRHLPLWRAVNDSKALTAARRDDLFHTIQEHTLWGMGEASVEEIDSINILQASFLAMRRALLSLTEKHAMPDHALIDGKLLPKDFPCPASALIGGDGLSVSIAAASILAKVTRDRHMQALAKEYPDYGWQKNAGYGTRQHMQALAEHGITQHHRRSFAPVKRMLAGAPVSL
jgi:ribonuclease HII